MNNEQKFYEFNKHEYYGLVVAESEEKAYEIYHQFIGGESIEQVKAEGKPDEVTFLKALANTIHSDISYGDPDVLKTTIKDYYDAFKSYENTAILIDGSLL